LHRRPTDIKPGLTVDKGNKVLEGLRLGVIEPDSH
jgi:hypothetical protein